MPTSCSTHAYDGKLREKWFEIRPMLIERYLPNCVSFEETIKQIEEWLEKKYYNVKRIGRARRSIKILTQQRKSNFDSRNDIDVEELLPILWDKVKNQDDIHDTFYEQLCDITGGSCSQGRSTRLFQFLFLFDLPTNIEDEKTKVSTEQQSEKTTDENSPPVSNLPVTEEEIQPAVEETNEEEHSTIVEQKSSVEEKPQDEQQSESIDSPSTE